MANKSQAADESGAVKVKKKRGKLFLIIVLVGLFIGVGGATLFAYSNNEFVAKFKQKEVELQSMPLKEFIVNLSDANYRRYLKISLVVEYEHKKTAEEVEKNNYKVRDAIINLISSKSVAEISDIEGKEKLKRDLIIEVNKNLKQGKIESLFWTDFVIQ